MNWRELRGHDSDEEGDWSDLIGVGLLLLCMLLALWVLETCSQRIHAPF